MGVLSFHDVAKAVFEEQSFENRMPQELHQELAGRRKKQRHKPASRRFGPLAFVAGRNTRITATTIASSAT